MCYSVWVTVSLVYKETSVRRSLQYGIPTPLKHAGTLGCFRSSVGKCRMNEDTQQMSRTAKACQGGAWDSTVNPFTAMLAAPSLGKRRKKVPNLKSLSLSFPLYEHVGGFISKCTVLKVDLFKDHQSMLFAGVYVCTFSLEILLLLFAFI